MQKCHVLNHRHVKNWDRQQFSWSGQEVLPWQASVTCCLGGTRSHPSVDVELSPLHSHCPGFSSYAPHKLWVQQAECTGLQVLNPTSTDSRENTARILSTVTEWRGNMKTTLGSGVPGGKQIFPNKKKIHHKHYGVWFNFLGSVNSAKWTSLNVTLMPTSTCSYISGIVTLSSTRHQWTTSLGMIRSKI